MYKISLVIPLISIAGVVTGGWMQRRRIKAFYRQGSSDAKGHSLMAVETHDLKPNWFILGGSGLFVGMTLAIGLSSLAIKKEIIFLGSLVIIVFLIHLVLRELAAEKRREIIGIAVIIFVFRAMPTAGAGASWWQIDVLGFDESFFGTLRQISAILTIVGLFALRGWMSRRPIPYLVVFLSIYSTVMLLPFIGMYHGLHEWTTRTFGFGARTIAIIDTMADSPLGQVAMVPMLAWIAKEAPQHQKATYFAIMAAFTNLALSASQLATKYLNMIFVIERGQYAALGALLMWVAIIGLIVPITAVLIFNPVRRFQKLKAV
jgi:hypothetical protein